MQEPTLKCNKIAPFRVGENNFIPFYNDGDSK